MVHINNMLLFNQMILKIVRYLAEQLSWEQANEYCQNLTERAHLWLPYSQEEEQTIVQIFEQKVISC